MVSKEIRKYILAIVIVLAIDLFWIFILMNSFYTEQFSRFLRPEKAPLWAALLAWALIPLGIVVFVDRVSKTKAGAFFNGALYGLILYGVYDFTNYATLANWPLALVIVDVLWGTFLCAISSLLLHFMSGGRKWKELGN